MTQEKPKSGDFIPEGWEIEDPVKPTGSKEIKPEEIVLVTPNKPMSTEEVLQEMRQQGMRPLTAEELFNTLQPKEKLTPKNTDIVIEKNLDKKLIGDGE
jgi:hypothetical protein